MDSPMKSPAPGLEKLASELRQERQKCTSALQDRAKQKIEIERLKQQLQDSQADLASTNESYTQLTEAYAQLERNVGDLEASLNSRDQEVVKLKHLYDITHTEVLSSREELSHCVIDMENLQSERDTVKGKVEDLETMLTAKNALIHELEEEAVQLKRINELHENRLKEATYELNRRSEELDTVRRETFRADALSSSYQDLQQSSDEVRSELEQALERSAELANKLRETQEHCRSMQLNEQKQRLEISTLSSQVTKLRNELNDYNLMQIELTRKADAEAESASISRDKAAEALRSKQHLEGQVASLKNAHESALKRCEDLEEEAVHLNGRILTLQGDLAMLNDKLRSKDNELNGAEGQRAVAAEVESLRGQLSEMRKKLLRKDLDNEVDRISPAAAMERDRNSRRVYESIIEDLRHQLDTTTSALHDANQRLSDARARLLRMDEMQEEMELYKETAKKVAIESHSVVSSVSEAQQRNERNAHEMHICMRDLKTAESEVHALRVEREKLLEVVDESKAKAREMVLEKMGAERRLSEQIAKCARVEAVLDEYRLRTEAAELELSRSERLLQEHVVTVSDLKAKRAESERQRMVLLEKLQVALSSSASAHGKDSEDRELDLEVLKLTQTKEILERELSTLTKSLRSQKQINAEQLEEIDRLRAEVDQLQQEKSLFRRDTALHESGRTELQLKELRKELTKTVDDWKESESTKESHEQSSGQANTRLEREKEKVGLLQTQVGLLEDRLDVMSQELAVFRSLDIYHNSMDAELRSYRNSAIEAPSPSITASNRSARARSSSPISRSHSPVGQRRFADLSSSVDRREREAETAADNDGSSSSDDDLYLRKGIRWGETSDLMLSNPHRDNDEDDFGPALSLADMSRSRANGASRGRSTPHLVSKQHNSHYTHNSRDEITPSLSGSARKNSTQRSSSPAAPARSHGRSSSPASSSRRLFDTDNDGGATFRGRHQEYSTHRQSNTANSPERDSHTFLGYLSTRQSEDWAPKRESVSRPGLQLDGSLNRSINHPVATRAKVDSHNTRVMATGSAGGNGVGDVQRGGLLGRVNKASSSSINSKPSKLEFERAKKLLARR